ncbi:MAG: ABC transporter ATP-binding protein [Actinomycetota bacterium]
MSGIAQLLDRGGQYRAVIEVVDVRRSLGGKPVLRGVGFLAVPGLITGLLGPNGAGKTTTLRLIATLLRPDSGSVRVCGLDTVANSREVRRSIGLLTEDPGLYDRLTCREQLVFAARSFGLSSAVARRRVEELAELLSFHDRLDSKAAVLSKGTRQKIALARALVHDPPVLLLDEPTASLDVSAAAAVHDLLTGSAFAHKTVLLSTHILTEVQLLCRNVVGITAGRVVVEGSVEDIARRHVTGEFRLAFLDALKDEALAGTMDPPSAALLGEGAFGHEGSA